jgi:hypothetical protein
MASSDDFKKQLKAGNLTEALTLALTKAVELKITTWVASSGDAIETAKAKPGHRLRTHINTIEGYVENEIGDQFIGNAPYKELQQFHLDQVSDGNKIIQSNLKSLQKLFEVLIAMRSQAGVTPVLEQKSPSVENPLLPPAQAIPDADLVTDPQESAVDDFRLSPNLLTEDIIFPDPPFSGELVTDPQESAVDDFRLNPNLLTEDIIFPDPPFSGEAASFLAVPADTKEALDEETDEDDDWDDSVLGLLESLPVEAPDQLEPLDPEEEDWRNFIDEEEFPEPPTIDLPVNQDRGLLPGDDFDPSQTSDEPNIESSSFRSDKGLGNLVEEKQEPESAASAPEPNIEPLNSEDDEDWGDLVEDERSPEPFNLDPSRELLALEEDDEWDDWVEEESEPLQELPVNDLDLLDIEEDDGWEDFEVDSDLFAAVAIHSDSTSEVESEEMWDDFATDELEPYTPLLDVDTNVGAQFDSSDAFDESVVQETDYPDVSEYLERDAFTETGSLEELDRNQLDVLFGDEKRETQTDPAIPNNKGVDSAEEALFADMQFEEYTADTSLTPEESDKGVFDEDSEPLTVSEDNLERHLKSDEKRLPPPPPPPNRFPNQNN